MNERFNHLRLEAGISRLSDHPGLVVINEAGSVIDPLIGLEKFTELIIKECTDVVLATSVEYIEIDAMHRIRDNIKKHFGVEE